MNNWSEQTLGEIVNQNHRAATVLEKFHLDFCCGGKQTLAAACEKRKIPMTSVSEALEELNTSHQGGSVFQYMTNGTLIQYILTEHHQYIREQSPFIQQHLDKVSLKHGERYPYMTKIAGYFRELHAELLQHMQKEENILFPAIRHLIEFHESNGQPFPGAEKLLMPMMVMEQEHESAGQLLEAIRTASADFKIPEDACNTFRLVLAELQEFEQKLHEHVHLENNKLFPAVKQMMQVNA